MTIPFNRVKYLCTLPPGAGAFHVDSSVPGFRTPGSAGIADGTAVSYTAQTLDLTRWETGHGVYHASSATISRDTPFEGSSALPVVFTAPVLVWIDLLAQDIATAFAPGGSPGQLLYNNGGTSVGGVTVTGDGTISTPTGQMTVLKTSGVPFAPSATVDTTNAANITSGNLSTARLNGGLSASSSTFWRGDGTWATAGGAPGGSSGQVQYNNGGALGGFTFNGDLTVNTGSGLATLASIIAGGGPTGSASVVPVITYDAKGRLTAVTTAAISISAGSVTGLATIATSGSGADLTAASVTNAKLAVMPAHTHKGNNTGSPATPIDLTQAQLTAEVNLFTSSLSGAVSASGGGTTNFLRADGSWAAPPGAGGGGNVSAGATLVNDYVVIGQGTTNIATPAAPHKIDIYNAAVPNYERLTIDWTAVANVVYIGTEQGGTGAAREMRFIAGGAEVFRVDTLLRTTFGGFANALVQGSPSVLEVVDTGAVNFHASFIGYGNNNPGASNIYASTFGATPHLNGLVTNGSTFGQFQFLANDGTGYQFGVYFDATVDGTSSAGNMPSRFDIWTTRPSSVSPVEGFRLDSLQRMLLAGQLNPVGGPQGANARIQSFTGMGYGVENIYGNASSYGHVEVAFNNSSASACVGIAIARSRSTSYSSPYSTTANGDQLGVVDFYGTDGSQFDLAASISAVIDGPVTSGKVPGKFSFYTSTVGGVETEAFSVTSAQRLQCVQTNGRADIGGAINSYNHAAYGGL